MSIYRKIYEQHYGSIPKDGDGRSYDIHHINGNHSDNRIENLKAVTIEEHYQIHYDQGDWHAALLIGNKMKKSPETISELSKRTNAKRVKDGTHNFLGPENNLRNVKNGVHPFIGDKNPVHKKIKDGTHPFLSGDYQKKINKKSLSNGNHTSQNKKCCPHCGKLVDISNYGRWHGDKCKVCVNKSADNHL